jgi:hypothetical protein
MRATPADQTLDIESLKRHPEAVPVRCDMTRRDLAIKARSEWGGSASVRDRYPTFSHYWRERYARVYRLNTAGTALRRLLGRASI